MNGTIQSAHRTGGRWRQSSAALLGILCTLMAVLTEARESHAQVPLAVVQPTCFGLHIHNALKETPWPGVPFGSWRLWDAGVSWPQLEPQSGIWRFANLDHYVDEAERRHVTNVLPLGWCTPWASARPSEPSAHRPGMAAEPRDLADWRRYVEAVVRRYKGRIEAYEIWNEPNLPLFYSGTPEKMIELARVAFGVIKAIDPAALVVSPGPTDVNVGQNGQAWLEDYMGKGGGDFADVVGCHFYVPRQAPEDMIPAITAVKEILRLHNQAAKPLWNTETGWLIQNGAPGNAGLEKPLRFILPADLAASYVARSYILHAAAGVERLYWYAWDNGRMGLTEPGGKILKQSAIAFASVQSWIVGASVVSCAPDGFGTWICTLTNKEGHSAWIVWNPDRQLTFRVPPAWHALRQQTLLGDGTPRVSRDLVEVGPMPILLEGLRH